MKIIATWSVILVLAGCAATPAYQSMGSSGIGFTETQLDTNVFTVTFQGNEYTRRDEVNDFALLRSAELALEHGFQYFIIIDAQQYSKNSTHTTPATAETINHGLITTTTVSGGQTYNISAPGASNTIVCFTAKPQGFAYNAGFIVKSIKQKHDIQDAPG